MAEPWTAEQHAAIRETGHLLLAANAGTGKTSTVVGKILWRIGFDIGLYRLHRYFSSRF